jgi:deoxycytidylate deaminase
VNDEGYFHEAAAEAAKATCRRARCGSVVVLSGEVIGRGWNGPAAGLEESRTCDEELRDSPKPKSDRTCCVHAEWRAILDAKTRGDIRGADLYFMRVDEAGATLHAGNPYCTVCSRLALDAGIARFGLWHESGPRMYDALDYNARSYDFHRPRK